MKGFVALDETDDAARVRLGAAERDQRLMFHLTIRTDDVDRFVADPEHGPADRVASTATALGGAARGERGVLQPVRPDERPARQACSTGCTSPTPTATRSRCSATRTSHDDPGFDVWQDTSTLFTTVLAGHVRRAADEPGGRVVAPASSPSTCPTSPSSSRRSAPTARPRARVEKFGRLFLGQLWEVYGRHWRGAGMTDRPPSHPRGTPPDSRSDFRAAGTTVSVVRPALLLQTGPAGGAISKVFGDVRRQARGCRPPLPTSADPATSPTGDELWLDYVSDIGDGFDATVLDRPTCWPSRTLDARQRGRRRRCDRPAAACS